MRTLKRIPGTLSSNKRLALVATGLVLSSLLATAISSMSGRASHFSATASTLTTYEILHSFTGNAGYGFNGDTDGANP